MVRILALVLVWEKDQAFGLALGEYDHSNDATGASIPLDSLSKC